MKPYSLSQIQQKHIQIFIKESQKHTCTTILITHYFILHIPLQKTSKSILSFCFKIETLIWIYTPLNHPNIITQPPSYPIDLFFGIAHFIIPLLEFNWFKNPSYLNFNPYVIGTSRSVSLFCCTDLKWFYDICPLDLQPIVKLNRICWYHVNLCVNLCKCKVTPANPTL